MMEKYLIQKEKFGGFIDKKRCLQNRINTNDIYIYIYYGNEKLHSALHVDKLLVRNGSDEGRKISNLERHDDMAIYVVIKCFFL